MTDLDGIANYLFGTVCVLTFYNREFSIAVDVPLVNVVERMSARNV